MDGSASVNDQQILDDPPAAVGGCGDDLVRDCLGGAFDLGTAGLPAEAEAQVSAGRKDDAGKFPLHLLPPDAIIEIARVLDFGAKKYAPRNWERGMAWSRPYAALLRHMFAWWSGEKADPETGLSHLAHAGCCILFLMSYEKREIGDDDRP